MSNYFSRVIMTTDDSTIRESAFLYDFTAQANITMVTSSFFVRHSLSISTDKVFTISAGLTLYWYTHMGGVIDNDGSISGGTFRVFNGGGGTYTPNTLGTITSNMRLDLYSGGTSTTFALPGPTTFGGSLLVESSDATATITLSHGSDYDLTVSDDITVGVRGVIIAGASTVSCGGDFDSSSGAFTSGTSTVVMTGSEKTIKTASASSLYNLHIAGMITASSSLNVSHDLTVDVGKRITISVGLSVTYDSSGGGAYSNLGQIAGLGTMTYSLSTSDRSIAFGSLSCIVSIKALNTATADRTLTMTSDSIFAWQVIVSSDHASYLMVFDTTIGNVTVGNSFTNGTRGMVYYSYPWTILGIVASPWVYQISKAGNTYYAQNTMTSMIEKTEDDYADNVTQYAVDASLVSNEVHFGNGTFVFQCPTDFYVGGWNYSVLIEGASNLTVSGSSDTILKFRDGLEVGAAEGVTIFLIRGPDTEFITIKDIAFEPGTEMSGAFRTGVWILNATSSIKVEGCTFTNLAWGIWGDSWPEYVGSGNEFTGNSFIGANTITTNGGLALHNGPSGVLVSGNTFDGLGEALFIDTVKDVMVSDNIFNNSGWFTTGIGSAILCWECEGEPSNITISENEFFGNEDHDDVGIRVDQVSGKGDCNNISIEQNALSDFKYGIIVEAANDTRIENNSFMSCDMPIDDDGTRTIINQNVNYSLDAGFTGAISLTWGYVEFVNGMRLGVGECEVANVTLLQQTSNSIGWNTEDADLTFILSGLDADMGYKVYQDGVVITTGTGPSFSFTATGGGEFEVVVWNTKTVSTLVVLTINMVGLGIMVSVAVGWVLPFARDIKGGKFRSTDQMIKELIHGVVFIVVGCFMYAMLYNVAIG